MSVSNITLLNYGDFLIHLGVDVVAIIALGVLTYIRRHGRRDLLTCMVAFNVGLFVVLAVIDLRATSLGVGFGLFALLSIISLRSDPFSVVELGYFFVALVIGVVNAVEVGGETLRVGNELFAVLLSAVAVGAVWIVDHPRLRRASGRQQITIDTILVDPARLQAELARRLCVDVTAATVLHTDYVTDTMLVDVRYVGRGGERAPAPRDSRPSVDQS